MYCEGLQQCRPFLLGANKILRENSATGMRPMSLPGCFSGSPSNKRLS